MGVEPLEKADFFSQNVKFTLSPQNRSSDVSYPTCNLFFLNITIKYTHNSPQLPILILIITSQCRRRWQKNSRFFRRRRRRCRRVEIKVCKKNSNECHFIHLILHFHPIDVFIQLYLPFAKIWSFSTTFCFPLGLLIKSPVLAMLYTMQKAFPFILICISF